VKQIVAELSDDMVHAWLPPGADPQEFLRREGLIP
jgi:hypothetical protein